MKSSSRRSWKSLRAASTLGLALALALRMSDARADQESQVPTEYIRALAGLEDMYSSVVGSGRLIIERENGTKGMRQDVSKIYFARNRRGLAKYTRVSERQGVTGEVTGCITPVLSFALGRKAMESQYIIRSIGKLDDINIRYAVDSNFHFCNAPYTLVATPIRPRETITYQICYSYFSG